jgi:hypothetical protein
MRLSFCLLNERTIPSVPKEMSFKMTWLSDSVGTWSSVGGKSPMEYVQDASLEERYGWRVLL